MFSKPVHAGCRAPSQAKKAGRFELGQPIAGHLPFSRNNQLRKVAGFLIMTKLVAAAADDDDDDFFAEFDVDLDMDGDSAPPKQALSTIPEKSSGIDLNPTSDIAADGTASDTSFAPMATDQLTSGSAAVDAALQTSDGTDVQSGLHLDITCYNAKLTYTGCKTTTNFAPAGSATAMDAVTGTCDGQANTTATASPTQDVLPESATAVIEDSLNQCSPTGNEAVHDAEASAPTSRPAPLPMLSQVADDSVPPQHDNVAAQSAGEMEATQLHKNHATAQPPRAAATAQPSDSHDTHPAQAFPTGQSENANPMPRSTCDQPMTEADGNHAPSQQAGIDTNSELADGGAPAQLIQGDPTTQVTEGTAPAEAADAEPGSDEGAIPMQTDLPSPTDHKMPSVDKPDQPSSVTVIGAEALETAQPQSELQSGRATADAEHCTQSEVMAKMQSGLDHPALDDAGSDAMLNSEMADTTIPAEAANTSVPGTAAVQQEIVSTGVQGSLACGSAQPDTDMVQVTSHEDQPSDHLMREGEPHSRYPGHSKQILPAASGAHSEVELRQVSASANSPSNEATPSNPTGIGM